MPPFERQVTMLVSYGLHATVEAVEYALRKSDTAHFPEAILSRSNPFPKQSFPEAILSRSNPFPKQSFPEAIKDGVSANLLDAVIGLMGLLHNAVDVNFAWSPEIPVPADAYKGVTPDPSYRSIIEAVSRERKEQEPDPTAQLIGVVEGLRGPQGDDIGHITLSTFIDGKSRKVNIHLDAEIYEPPIFAHSTKRVVYSGPRNSDQAIS
jgi:hypothetical protein